MSHNYSPPVHHPCEHRAWMTLSQLRGLSLANLWKYVDHYRSASAVLENIRDGQLKARGALALPESSYLDRLEDMAERRGERLLTPADSEYPHQLFDLPQPPALLFVAGQSSIQTNNQIAIVGSRLATPYGMSQAASLARGLAQRGVIVTSGLARGIDAQAHRGALQVQGRTIAVVGNGLDVCYPREHASLQKLLQREGNVISEYPYGTPPHAGRFPARNRLIAALALGTIIVQASRRSGALITANIANDLGREVMVVPGALDVCQSTGCLQLLMEGANPIRHVRDIFDVMQIFEDDPLPDSPPEFSISEQARSVITALDSQGATIDTLVERCHLGPGFIAALLNQLSLSGMVQRLPEGVWIPVY